MNIPRVFDFSDYVEFIKALVSANREQRGFQSSLCNEIQCQPSTFSKSLTGQVHLTRDHLANICGVLRLNELETEYIFSIYDQKTSSSEHLRKMTQKKSQRLKREAFKIKEQIKDTAEFLDPQIAFEFYSSWIYAAINIAVLVPELRTFEKLQRKLNIDEGLLLKSLEKLIEWGFLKKTSGGYESQEKSLHLDRDHPVSPQDHVNWRLRAMDDITKRKEESLHYSSIFTVSKDDFDDLKKLLIDNIKKQRKVIEPSKSEKLCVCNIDLFEI